MTTRIHPSTQTLYDRDYVLWLETTIEQLRQGKFSEVDIENLLEELESMGRSDRRAMIGLLTRILEHLLKLAYWESQRDYNANHWKSEITNFRFQLSKLLSDSPSLQPYLETIFEECYSAALRSVSRAMGVKLGTLPEHTHCEADPCGIVTPEQALDDNWFPDDSQ